MSQAQRNIPSFSTVTSSFKSYISSLPLLTTIIACVSIILYVIDAVTNSSNTIYNALALSPEEFFKGQIWRLLTYPFPHPSLGHILFNLLVFLPLSTTIEHTIGTLEYSYVLMTVFTIMSGSFYLPFSLIFNNNEWTTMTVGGLSTWILGVVVWESRELAGKERDIFGLFKVPAHFYPIVLLSIMVILFSFKWVVSFLCGLFSGYFYSFGYISCILPSSGFFSQLESKSILSKLVKFRGFIKAEEGSRGGWWIPLWNEESLEESIESSNNLAYDEHEEEQNDDDNLTSFNAEETNNSDSQNLTTNSIFVVSSNSSTPEATPALTTATMIDPLNSSATNVTLAPDNNTHDAHVVVAE